MMLTLIVILTASVGLVVAVFVLGFQTGGRHRQTELQHTRGSRPSRTPPTRPDPRCVCGNGRTRRTEPSAVSDPSHWMRMINKAAVTLLLAAVAAYVGW